ncbi:CbtB domain-containing protein [Williamsia sterculiae]|uniref:Probable cobalt transporter subunit (CbtB) n=1 Tax=Williamsia sterculiae TaxID=1344003 RepID=A0A1N7G7W4_9NOCA|nr:CbtB-domain containing protein [Williamsia sterculiae]SIS08681.1 Probable cobalt transporter subunit (CbtB) [Williamsia sterculiae]
MTTLSSHDHRSRDWSGSGALSRTRVAVILTATVLLALLAYYFIGVDEGMTSLFGQTMVVHEWVHDARHFLGFPCH